MKTPQIVSVLFVSIIVMLLGAMYAFAAADPTAPTTLTKGATSTFDPDNYAAVNISALAGDISAVTIVGISQTRAWQGYYGNVSGYITLDDADNNTFYNWSVAEPRGQVYATLSNSPTWASVDCAVWAADAADFHTTYGINAGDYDNVTNTYNVTNHPDFQIASRTVTTCPTTYIWQSDVYQAANFPNFLLQDSTKVAAVDSWVFGTIMEDKDPAEKFDDLLCYNGQYCDFQLLVAEDGHGTDVDVTQYYFWVDFVG